MSWIRVTTVAVTTMVAVPALPYPGLANPAASTPSPCFAIVLPSAQGFEGSATDVASALRDLFISYLTGPSIRAIPLDARLPSQAAIEARQKNCANVVMTSMTRKRAGGARLGGVMGQAIGTAAWRVPYGTGAAGAVAAGAAAGAAHAVTGLAADTRKKDEIVLSYRVGTPDDVERARPVTTKARARVDGEDLLTPLVEHAAQGIVSSAR